MQLVIMCLKSPLIQSSSPALFCFMKLIFSFWLSWAFVALLGLSLAVASRGFSLAAARRLPIAVASLVELRRL